MNEQEHNSQGGPLTPQPPPETSGHRSGDTIEEITATLRDLISRVPEGVSKAAEGVSKVVERAINVRDTTVMLRLSDASSDALDTLVAAGVFKSRAEAAAFLIDEGIKAQASLFQKVQEKLNEIERLRDELRHTVSP